MKRKLNILLLLLAVQLFAQKQPNIVLIMADDMGFSDIGCYGGEIKTPNLDKLAENGVRFTQFYNNARCCPTRAALLTGLYPHQVGVGGMVGHGYGDLNNKCVTIAEALKTNGYATYMTGKWHVADSNTNDDIHNWPIQRGFDKFYGTIKGVGSYFDPYTLTNNNENVKLKPDDKFYYTDAISDSTVTFLDKHFKQKANKPFFFYVAYTAPHWPLHALEKDIAKYEGVFDKGWDVLREERLVRMKKMGIIPKNTKLSQRDFRATEWNSVENKEWEIQRMKTYAAQIDNMDQGIGRIIDKLKKEGEFENTLIIFLSDNGGCAETLQGVEKWVSEKEVTVTLKGKKVTPGNVSNLMSGPATTYMSYGESWANLSNTPYRKFKKSGHEGGVATPFIMHWPKKLKKKNVLKKDVASIIDVLPTIVDISNTSYPLSYNGNKIQPMEGLSLMPVFKGENLNRDEWFMEHGSNKAYRKGNWKVAWSKDKDGKKWELFNLKKDPTEQIDVAVKYPKRLSEMKARWFEWGKRVKVVKK
ncbi:arylsulfatase [Lutibacter oricola]|uniref:Arylsulfatase n=1 Tax=Lutibacter oricola TaxID=762486 RepID=A0A1H2SMW6_9FLAO|nr:arylsulfatase [Lutibacter oricola]SDW32424.1 arylsulfatase [Lutibacter oricola]